MIIKGLRDGAVRAPIVGVGVVALVLSAAGTAMAGAPLQSQQEQIAAEQTRVQEEMAREKEAMEKAMVAAKRALEESQGRLQEQLVRAGELERGKLAGLQDRLRMVQERMPRLMRLHGMPGMSWSGVWHHGNPADVVLAQADELELSDQQVEQIRAARKQARRDEIQRDAAIEVAELDLEDLLADADEGDLGGVENKMREIANLRVDGRIADLRLKRQIHGILTPEQKEQLEEMDHNAFLLRRDGAEPEVFFFGDDDDDFDLEDMNELRFGDDGVMKWKLYKKKEADKKEKSEGDPTL